MHILYDKVIKLLRNFVMNISQAAIDEHLLYKCVYINRNTLRL